MDLTCPSGESCLIVVDQRHANECLKFMQFRQAGSRLVKVKPVPFLPALILVVFASDHFSVAKQFWQHTGCGVSSRLAEFYLGAMEGKLSEAAYQELQLKHSSAYISLVKRLSSVYLPSTVDSSDAIHVFPGGMSAIYNVFQMVHHFVPQIMPVMFGFPYLDTLKILQKWSADCMFIAGGKVAELERVLQSDVSLSISSIWCEFPSNPLLNSPDLSRLFEITSKRGIPLIVDDTIGNPWNTCVLPFCDVVVSSLTKIFSGSCNVMAGSVALNPQSQFFARFRTWMTKIQPAQVLWTQDLIQLELNSRNVKERIIKINHTTERICDYLTSHPLVSKVYYPKYNDSEAYVRYRTTNPDMYSSHEHPSCGFGGLLSLELKNGSRTASVFYDSLKVFKGPSLGTNFTLCCPYTLIAHYLELDEVEQHGVSRWLIRISIGLEEYEDLKSRFDAAFAAVASGK